MHPQADPLDPNSPGTSLSPVSTISMSWDSDVDSLPSPSSSESSFDEEDVNRRIKPFWPKYRALFKAHGFHLDTVRDVRPYYRQLQKTDNYFLPNSLSFLLSCEEGSSHDDELCPDVGLPDNLFRGHRISDGKKFVTKAVHAYSREYDVICLLSRPPLRNDPMNHTIPILDLFEDCGDHIAFAVMEEWSSHLLPNSGPCCLRLFLAALRQCIEHAAFMHKHHLVHLDISLRNLLTDFEGNHAYIDFELSRRFDGVPYPRICGYHATEIPPECETRQYLDPFKIDVWALGVLMLRACKISAFDVPELLQLVQPMVHDVPERRPPLHVVLRAFDEMVQRIQHRVGSGWPEEHGQRIALQYEHSNNKVE